MCEFNINFLCFLLFGFDFLHFGDTFDEIRDLTHNDKMRFLLSFYFKGRVHILFSKRGDYELLLFPANTKNNIS
jgi:hypothetical protein